MMGWSPDSRGARHQRSAMALPDPRATMRIALVVAEAATVLGVLAVARHVSVLWCLWAAAVVLAMTGLDRRLARRVTPRLIDSTAQVFGRTAVAALAIAPLARSVAAADLAVLGLQVAIGMVLARGLVVAAMRACSRRGWIQHRVLIVGSGEVAERLARAVRDHTSTGMRITGLVDDDPRAAVAGLTRLGGLGDLEGVARQHGIDRILLAFSAKPEAQMVRLLVDCERVSADIYAVPRFFEVGVDAPAPDEISGIPLTLLPRPMRRRTALVTKRAFDLAVSLLTLALLSPVLLVVAALVRYTGPRPFLGKRPVVFRQDRVGIDGRLFTMLKFRSMIPNDDGDTTWSVRGDPRVTRLGAFLRRSGLDEAPQLWNVVRGDMSLVGPRPERPLMVNIFTEFHLRVPDASAGAARHHRLGAGQRVARRYVDRRPSSARQLLRRHVDLHGGHGHPGADRRAAAAAPRPARGAAARG